MKILGIDPGIGRVGWGTIEVQSFDYAQDKNAKIPVNLRPNLLGKQNSNDGGFIRRPLADQPVCTGLQGRRLGETEGDALVRTTGNNEYQVGSYGCFETHKGRAQKEQMYQKYQRENDGGDDDGRRLYEIHCFLKELIEKEKPDEVAVESLFFAQNVKTAMMVSQARGAILLTVAQAGLPVFSYTPLQVKQALTGYGRAEKKQVQKMVQVILGMKEVPKQDDAADALAVAVTHAFSRKLGKLMK